MITYKLPISEIDKPIKWEERESEIFSDIIGYEGLYAISNHGRVWSYHKNILMKNWKNHGYLHVTLGKNGGKRHWKIARLVGLHFIENPENKPEVNHLKGKLDNYYKSVEWATPKENVKHAFETGLQNSDHCAQSVKATHIATGKEMRFYSTREAERNLKIGSGYVSAVLVGKYKSAKGYLFERIQTIKS